MKLHNTETNIIVITRPTNQNTSFKKNIESLGFTVFELPTITTNDNSLDPNAKKALLNLHDFDWIIFTSSRGVNAFFKHIKNLAIDKSTLATKKFAAVGPQTASAITKQGYTVSFVPSSFTTSNLGNQFPDAYGKKILLPRANIASPQLTRILKKKGGLVTNIPMYQTKNSIQPIPQTFLNLVKENKISYITFTSPSTIKGFLYNLQDTNYLQAVKNITVLSIGPVTTKFAKKNKFKQIITADIHTTDGIITKLKEINKTFI